MKYFQYSPEVNILLINHSDEKVELLYNDNPHPFSVPKIGPRPPYYCYPKYEPYYPII